MLIKNKIPKLLLTFLFFMLMLSNISFAEDTGLSEQEQICQLVERIQFLKKEVKKLDDDGKKPKKASLEDNIDVVLGGNIPKPEEENLQLDEYVDDVINDDGQGASGLVKKLSRSVDVSKSIPITTRGEETYIGSYSSSNTIPFGRISQTLFPATLMGQRSNYGDYAVYLGSYIENDLQAWDGSQITAQQGPNYGSDGFGMYTTTVYMYFMANIGHYVTFESDVEFWQGVGNFSDSFVMFGNIDDSPWFVTVGQYRPSIGSYSGGGNWTYGITTNLFRLNRVPNAALNYKDDTQTANLTVFNADNHPSFSLGYYNAIELSELYQVGFNAGYAYDIHGANVPFQNLGVKTGEINIDATMNISSIIPGTWSVGGGWGSTTTKSMAFNGYSNSLAGAFTVQTAYSYPLFGRGTNINVSFGHSYNADNLPTYMAAQEGEMVPTSGIQNQFIISSQRAYFDNNVLIGPEFTRQGLYNHQFMNTFTLDMSVYV